MLFPDNAKFVEAFPTQHGGAITGDWVSLKGYERACLVILLTTGADDTETTITIDKATSVTAGDESTGITITNFWTLYNMVSAAPATHAMTKGTAAASIVTVTDQSTTHRIVIDIDAAELPTSTYDFDCLQCTTAGSNAAHFISGLWILYNPRYAMAQANMISPIGN
jgi:hypothetical protein